MELVMGLFRFFYIILLIRMVLNIFLNIKRRAMLRDHIEAAQRTLAEGEEAEEPKQRVITMVEDKICGNRIQKEKAYIINKNDEDHYFCSWDCREKFINENRD